jgi:hypothetical protein
MTLTVTLRAAQCAYGPSATPRYALGGAVHRLQGNTIMVFTVVTILFLPASFMTSFFALLVTQFQCNGEGEEKMKSTYVVTWINMLQSLTQRYVFDFLLVPTLDANSEPLDEHL